jgi:hypothetical protein
MLTTLSKIEGRPIELYLEADGKYPYYGSYRAKRKSRRR